MTSALSTGGIVAVTLLGLSPLLIPIVFSIKNCKTKHDRRQKDANLAAEEEERQQQAELERQNGDAEAANNNMDEEAGRPSAKSDYERLAEVKRNLRELQLIADLSESTECEDSWEQDMEQLQQIMMKRYPMPQAPQQMEPP